MKLFFKIINKPLLAVICLGIFLRFYQLETRTNFTADQGRDYLVVRRMILDKKPTLLGPKVSVGEFFFGPLYYYLLAPALIIGNYDPLSGAVMTVLLDSLSLIIFALLSRSLLATSLYATFPLLVNMVKVPLNPFVIPFFSVLFLLFLRNSFIAGFVSGLLFQLHFATSPMIIIGLIAMLRTKHRLLNIGSYICGLIIGVLPMIAFDIRHQLFNSTRMLEFLQKPSTAHLSDHYLIAFFPVIFLLITKLASRLHLTRIILVMIIIINIVFVLKPVNHGYLMPEDWNLPGVRKATALIAFDNPEPPFAVAATLDGDTRAMPYRYLLEAKYSKIPLGVEEYPLAKTLYVVTRDPAEMIIKNPVWEISSIQPATVTKTWPIQNGILLHKLEKL